MAMDCKIILVRRYLLRLIKITSLLMNKLWRCRCDLVHIKASEEVEIEEYQDLLDELDVVLSSKNCQVLINKDLILAP